jgi:predicted XRE-type DNA-binding protein
MTKATNCESSGNVFADLGFPPAQAENLLLRADLIIAITSWFNDAQLTQAQAAKLLGVTQPRFNALLKGRIDEFSLDALANIASGAGLKITLGISKREPKPHHPASQGNKPKPVASRARKAA